MGCRVVHDMDEASVKPTSSTCSASSTSASARRCSQHQRYTQLFGLNKAAWPNQTGCAHHAPGRSIAVWKLTVKLPTPPFVDSGAGDQRLAVRMAVLFWSTRQSPQELTELSKLPGLICFTLALTFVLSQERNSCWLIPILRVTVRPIQSHEFSADGERSPSPWEKAG